MWFTQRTYIFLWALLFSSLEHRENTTCRRIPFHPNIKKIKDGRILNVFQQVLFWTHAIKDKNKLNKSQICPAVQAQTPSMHRSSAHYANISYTMSSGSRRYCFVIEKQREWADILYLWADFSANESETALRKSRGKVTVSFPMQIDIGIWNGRWLWTGLELAVLGLIIQSHDGWHGVLWSTENEPSTNGKSLYRETHVKRTKWSGQKPRFPSSQQHLAWCSCLFNVLTNMETWHLLFSETCRTNHHKGPLINKEKFTSAVWSTSNAYLESPLWLDSFVKS